MPGLRASAGVALAALVLAGLVHAWLHASLRPLLQVSDEISYLSALQHEIYETDLSTTMAYRCASPPDGTPLFIDPGGKVGFRRAGAAALRGLCDAGVPSTTVFWLLRLLAGLGLPIMVLATALLVRSVAPGATAWSLGAAALVSTHPIAATFAGGITPDAWANAMAAVVLLSATRTLLGTAGWPEMLAMTLLAVVAASWKDTTLFLLPVVVAAGAGRVVRRAEHPRHAAAGAVALALAALTIGVVVIRLAPPASALATRLLPALEAQGLGLATATLVGLAAQLPAIAWSTYMPLGNFGATTLTLPEALAWLGPVALTAMATGFFVLASDRVPAVPGLVLGLWGVAIVACALQPAFRQAVDQRPEVFQARWLFPALAPAAVLGTWWLRGRAARGLALVMVSAASVAGLALVQIVGAYYVQVPVSYDDTHLFLRSSSNVPTDMTALRIWLERPTLLRGTPWLIGGLLAWCGLMLSAAVIAARLPTAKEPS